ncbi:hypothetical protein CDL15_Pgr013849 [Punica granatum]|uniref:Uncharacterized protein n=1 Tax=Punica granatum TaxID=22663 RepID=A0A218WI37_PUNGR|nr:hypothetical protein CDL15_Pgr013849 [Punica granatum]PKI72096.1 hypothetical protein CRG98_007483 [Punica granatum]
MTEFVQKARGKGWAWVVNCVRRLSLEATRKGIETTVEVNDRIGTGMGEQSWRRWQKQRARDGRIPREQAMSGGEKETANWWHGSWG